MQDQDDLKEMRKEFRKLKNVLKDLLNEEENDNDDEKCSLDFSLKDYLNAVEILKFKLAEKLPMEIYHAILKATIVMQKNFFTLAYRAIDKEEDIQEKLNEHDIAIDCIKKISREMIQNIKENI